MSRSTTDPSRSALRRHPDVTVQEWPALFCETCDNEVDVVDEQGERGVCRHCGVAFLLQEHRPTGDRIRDVG